MSARDRVYEQQVLEAVVKQVARRAGEDIAPFIGHVLARIEHGADLYGDEAFTLPDRDNVHEQGDECADAIAYALFELHLINANGRETPEGVHQLLFESMVAAATSHLKARQARRLLNEG